jgi:hypothetical protein
MTHSHEPRGTELVLIRREADDYTMTSAKCLCGVILIRETAPQGARYNWEEWRATV